MALDIEEKLAQIGITGTLYKLFLTAVRLGGASVTEVAAAAGLPRTTAHDALAKLEAEGLVKFVDHGKRRFVVAQDPGILLERIEARRQMLSDVMPVLRSMYHHESGQPNVRFHPGPEGIRTALVGYAVRRRQGVARDAIHEGADGRSRGSKENGTAIFRKRARRDIWVKVIRSVEREIVPDLAASQGISGPS